MSGGLLAQRVLQHAIDLGVRECCVCTGSRNSDLVHGLLQNPDVVHVHPFFEERSAAFFALGRQMATGQPVAVVTTSGTAVAELLPATIEAYYQARPLVLITADRPTHFRATGAPQAIEQVGLFGIYAYDAGDVIAETDLTAVTRAWKLDRPMHFNVCFEEPRTVPEISLTIPSEPNIEHDDTPEEDRLAELLHQPGPLLVMAGCWTPEPTWVALLEKLQAPILADLTSGLHGIPALHQLVLRGADQTVARLHFQRVLRLGGVPSFRAWRDLETQPEVSVLSVSERPFAGLARKSTWMSSAGWSPNAKVEVQEKPSQWRNIEDTQVQWLQTLLDRYPACEVACLQRLLAMMPDVASAFLGNSLAIRESILAAPPLTDTTFHANRGANGIDGSLSTFLGMSASQSREHWGFFGDLTTLYDLSAPSILTTMPAVKVRIVVINNGGGKIFRLLPNWKGLPSNHARVVENHHDFDFSAWAQSWGLGYDCLGTLNEDVDASAWKAHTVIEVRPDSQQSDLFWGAWRTPC